MIPLLTQQKLKWGAATVLLSGWGAGERNAIWLFEGWQLVVGKVHQEITALLWPLPTTEQLRLLLLPSTSNMKVKWVNKIAIVCFHGLSSSPSLSFLDLSLTNLFSSSSLFPQLLLQGKTVFSWGMRARPLDFIHAYKTYATFSFLRSIHCKLDILCIVKTLSSTHHQAQAALLTNLLSPFYSSGCSSLFQSSAAFPCYSFMTLA